MDINSIREKWYGIKDIRELHLWEIAEMLDTVLEEFGVLEIALDKAVQQN